MSFLRAVNTGHAGSLTSIHADSPEGRWSNWR
jgi:Flp pilus assembly CpaF family ATPase